jgi:hypothetical protein
LARGELLATRMASRTGRLESHVCEKLFNAGKIRHHAKVSEIN